MQILFDAGTASGLTDRQLLERVVGVRDDVVASAALEVMIIRHGPMVMRVCRSALGDSHDAEDACQATFLVLVRRIGTVRHLELVGGWLCGVASRVAARVRVESVRSRVKEERVAGLRAEALGDDGIGSIEDLEILRLVNEEVGRLPGNYRDVVVLCFMEGMTQEQAAARLGRPIGTVRSRVAGGKEILRKRLLRRGVEPVGAVVMGLDGWIARSGSDIVGSAVRFRVSGWFVPVARFRWDFLGKFTWPV